VTSGVTALYPDAYIDYLVYFHADRDLFECHEVLEEYWKQLNTEENSEIWVALIQVAVGLYHERRGNRAGAYKMLNSALSKLRSQDIAQFGLDKDQLLSQLETRVGNLNADDAQIYRDFDLPLKSAELLQTCLIRAAERNIIWLSPSDFTDKYLINKHTLRDRSAIIQSRFDELEKRRSQE
jgi:uncharacterized protein